MDIKNNLKKKKRRILFSKHEFTALRRLFKDFICIQLFHIYIVFF